LERVEGTELFDAALLRVAKKDGDLIGFVHGGVWPVAWLREIFGEKSSNPMGYLALIAVRSSERRRGVGTRLLSSLGDTLDGRGVAGLRADGRAYNGFYGNFFAPLAPLWGTTEGVAVAAEDRGTREFLRRRGFREEEVARSLSLQSLRRGEASIPADVVETRDFQPILGSSEGRPFPRVNHSVTWSAVLDGVHVGYLTAFPFGRSGSADRWGIHAWVVGEAWRGRGIGDRLLATALGRLEARGAREVETLVLPEESPAATRLYERRGFRAVAEWIVFG
jgi:GNAT superfamily N-acetyltransferase